MMGGGGQQVSLRILQADLIRDTKLIGKMAPYVLIKCSGREFRSATKKGEDKLPVWD